MTGSSSVGLAGWGFLAFAGVLLPIATIVFAIGERRRAPPGAADADHEPTRIQLYAQALFTHVVLLGVALGAAHAESVRLFPDIRVDRRGVAAAAITLVTVVALGELSWRSRAPAEREQLWVRRILPRTAAERRWWIVISAGAAIAEEVAYRGVFVMILATLTGSVVAAVAASAVAFALVHAPQGWASIGYVFVIALAHQALVLVTGTLLLAILVHFTYDVIAGTWLARRHGL